MLLREFTDEEKKLLMQKGVDPSSYLVDDSTADIYDRNNLPDLGTAGNLKENFKSALRSIPQTVAAIPQLVGALGETDQRPRLPDFLADAMGEPRQEAKNLPIGSSPASKLAKAINEKADEWLPTDARAGLLATVPGQAVGQIGSLMTGLGLVRSLAGINKLSTLAKLATAGGAGLTAADTIQEEQARQAEAGEDDSAKALKKALVMGGVSAVGENVLGLGKLFRSLEEPAAAGSSKLWRAIKQSAKSGFEESIEEPTQLEVVQEGKAPAAEVGKRALAGFLGGATGGGLAGLSAGRAAGLGEKVEESTESAAEKLAEAQAPVATEKAEESYKVDPNLVSAMVETFRRGERWNPPVKDPAGTMADRLAKAGVPLGPEEITALYNAWGGKAEGAPSVNELGQKMFAQYKAVAPASQEATAKITQARLAEKEKIEEQLNTWSARKNKLLETYNKSKEKGPGEHWLTKDRLEAELRTIDSTMQQLLAQHELLNDRPVAPQVVRPELGENEVVFKGTPAEAAMRSAVPAASANEVVLDLTSVPEELRRAADIGNLKNLQKGEVVGQGELSSGMTAPEGQAAEVVPDPIRALNAPPSRPLLMAPRVRLQGPAIPMPAPYNRTEGPAIPMRDAYSNMSAEDIARLEAIAKESAVILDKMRNGSNLTSEEIAVLQGYIQDFGPQEGEQRLPFTTTEGAGSESEDAPPPIRGALYSGLPIGHVSQMIKEVGEALSKRGVKLGTVLPGRLLYSLTRSASSRLTAVNPLWAYNATRWNKLFQEKFKIENRHSKVLETFKDWLNEPKVVDWLFASSNDNKWDLAKLDPKYRPEALRWIDFVKSFQREMKARGQYIMDSRGKAREPVEVEGYFPYAMDDKVDKEMMSDPARAAYWRDTWRRNWQHFTGNNDTAVADKALDEWRGNALGGMMTGEPTFGSSRRAYGVPIPLEMRSRNLFADMHHYISRYAADAAYTEVVQKDPLMRRSLGVKYDEKFNNVAESDRKVMPNKYQWADIIREGRRVDAPWLPKLKPGMDIGGAIGGDSQSLRAIESLVGSLLQRPMSRVSDTVRMFNTAQSLAGTVMMQLTTGIRDTTSGATIASEYLGMGNAVKGVVDAVADYKENQDKALRGGAYQRDVYAHQAAGVISDAAYQAVRTLRKYTGRQILDEVPKIGVYTKTYELVLSDMKQNGQSKLASEFCSHTTLAAGDPVAIAEETAFVVTQRVAPNYDPRSLPSGMVPQTRNILGHFMQLSSWGVARYNNWYEDTYLPAMKRGDMDRLVRGIFFGILGGAAASQIIEWLRGKKPGQLTWQEWLQLDGEEQIKEFAPTLFSLLQAQGQLGFAGDILAPAVAVASGRPTTMPDFEPAMPLVIVGGQVGRVLADFGVYASTKGEIDAYDLIDLAHELAKSMQIYRDLSSRFDGMSAMDLLREEKLYEKRVKRSATTDEPIQVPLLQRGQLVGGLFSMSKSVNRADEDRLRSLTPALERMAAETGYIPNARSYKYTDEFYEDVARRRGREFAEKLRAKAEEEQDMTRARKEVLRGLRSLRPAR